jgi:tetratricopeptide (TPR) repeat protein
MSATKSHKQKPPKPSAGQVPDASSPSRTSLRRNLVVGALLIAATLVVYLQVRRFDFVILDDAVYVGDNEHVRGGLSLENFRWAFITFRDGNWFPLTWISLMIDASAYGLWAGGYHLTNVVLHIANVLMVFAAFSKMTRNTLASALVASLFAVHPLHVESVAWVAERKDVLSMFFGLCALYAYVVYAQSGKKWRLSLSVFFFLCSLCSKQTFVTLPFVLLLLDYWPLGRLQLGQRRPSSDQANAEEVGNAARPAESSTAPRASRPALLLVEKIPFFALTAVFCVLAVFAQKQNRAVISLELIPLGTRILNTLVVYRLYLEKMFIPVGLVPFYPHPGALRLGIGDVVVSAVLLLGVTALAVFNVRKRPFLLVGWLWYLGTLVPMVGLVQLGGQQMADRYAYFPLLGCYLALVWLAVELVTRLALRPRVVGAIATAAVVVYASVAFVQVGYWRDSITLFRRATAAGKENPHTLTTLAWAYVDAKQFHEALPYLRRALELGPDFGQAHFLLGAVLQKESKFDEAAEHFRAALDTDDDNAAAHLNLGTILMAQREYAKARQHFDRVHELDPDNARLEAGLAELSLRQRNFEESIAHARRGLALDPTQKQCGRMIVIALREQGRFDEAIDQVRQMILADPNDRASHQELERLLSLRKAKQRPASR